MPETVNLSFTLFQGNKKTIRFTVRDGDQPEVGGVHPLFDLTGFTVQWAASPGNVSEYAPEAVIKKSSTVGSEITITDAVNGELEVFLVEADTFVITAGGVDALIGIHYHQLELVDALGGTLIVATGEIEIMLNVEGVAA